MDPSRMRRPVALLLLGLVHLRVLFLQGIHPRTTLPIVVISLSLITYVFVIAPGLNGLEAAFGDAILVAGTIGVLALQNQYLFGYLVAVGVLVSVFVLLRRRTEQHERPA